jgi:hypothetical protein
MNFEFEDYTPVNGPAACFLTVISTLAVILEELIEHRV